MSALCPLCFTEFPEHELELHVQRHFGDEEAGGGARGGGAGAARAGGDTSGVIDLTLSDSDDEGAPAKRQRSAGAADCSGDAALAAQLAASFGGGAVRGRDEPLWPPLPLGQLKSLQKREPTSDNTDWHELVRQAFMGQSSAAKSRPFCTLLSAPSFAHFATLDGLDAGWGCGWRNLQILSSHLLSSQGSEGELRRRLLFGGCGFVPDVAACQAWLESAWSAGFDPLGKAQLNHAIQGRTTWVGATEICAILRSFGLRAHVVDFKAGDRDTVATGLSAAALAAVRHAGVVCDGCDTHPIVGPRYYSTKENYDLCSACISNPEYSAHGPFAKQALPHGYAADADAHQPLLNFVWQYFSTHAETGEPEPMVLGSQIRSSTNRPPLMLQHDGHSRTIVGIERRPMQNGTGKEYLLLLLDPSHEARELREALQGKKSTEWPSMLKRGMSTFRKLEYSVLVVKPGEVVRGSAEWEAMKTIAATPPSRFFAARAN